MLTGGAAAFLEGMPGWLKAILGVLVSVGVLYVTWQKILPSLYVLVPRGHEVVFYRKGREIKGGKAHGPGFYLTFPVLKEDQTSNVMVQVTDLPTIKVDLGAPPVTHVVVGASASWRVSNPFRFQTVNADAERSLAREVASALREAILRNGELFADAQAATMRTNSLRLQESLDRIGITLVGIQLPAQSIETLNHKMMDGVTHAASDVIKLAAVTDQVS